MNQSEITELVTIYNDEWKNATDLKRAQLEKDNESFYDSIESLLGVSITGFGTQYTELETEWNNKVGFDITPITTNLTNLENVAYEVIDNITDELATITLTTPSDPGNTGPGSNPGNEIPTDPNVKPSSKTAQEYIKDYIEQNNLKNKGYETIKHFANFKSDTQRMYGLDDATFKKYVQDVIGDLTSGVISGCGRFYLDKDFGGDGAKVDGKVRNSKWYAFKYKDGSTKYMIPVPRPEKMTEEEISKWSAESGASTWLNSNSDNFLGTGSLGLYNDQLYVYNGGWWKVNDGHTFVDGYSNDTSKLTQDYKKKLNGYSKGGIVDYTGLAMVHGTPNTPEAFLNASQTEMFADLAANLQAIYSRPTNYTDDYDGSSEVTIENLTIAVDAELTNENIPEIGQSLADALFDGIRRSGYNINTKK